MKKNGPRKNLVGFRFGKLTVLEMMSQRNSRKDIVWKCKCDCGNITYNTTSSLTRKRGTKSCGCYNREMSILKNTKNIVGNKYGLLTVVSPAPKPDNAKIRGSWWYCDCDCGTKNVLANGGRLVSGCKKSCGCLQSFNEVRIERILKNEKVNYKTQYTFDDCINPNTGRKLKFDFAVFDSRNNLKFLIEYDGEQHFYGMRFTNNKKEREDRNRKIFAFDNIKNEYCKKNNIRLYRIDFTKKDNLEDIILTIIKNESEELKQWVLK